MKRLLALAVALFFVLGTAGLAVAEENPLKAKEAEVLQGFVDEIPEDAWVGVDQLHEEWLKRKEGKSDAYLIDVRTDSEYRAFHIEGTDHVQAGHMYVIPKKIKDPNAEIYIWCRTKHRATYVGGFLYKYGYKNVKVVDGGVVGWAKQGYPFVNKFTGNFKITGYRKHPSDFEKNGYKLRLWPLY